MSFTENDPISILGLDNLNLGASIYHLLTVTSCQDVAAVLPQDAAAVFLDILQKTIDETDDPSRLPIYRKCVIGLSKACNILPKSLFIHGVEKHENNSQNASAGVFADIFQGTYHQQKVALKTLRPFDNRTVGVNIEKGICNEAVTWRQLNHPNILPFIGVSTEPFSPYVCIVSPWMSNGTLMQYLAAYPYHDRIELLYGVAQGIEYLHCMDPIIVHGGIKGTNILINDKMQPVLSGFHLSVLFDSETKTDLSDTMSRGSTRWMAPELFDAELFGEADSCPSPRTDVYAFACLGIEVYSGRPPFPTASEPVVLFRVLQGQRPDLPTEGMPIHEDVWHLIKLCWKHLPRERPPINQVVRILKSILRHVALDPERFSKPLRILNEDISLLDAHPVASGGYASVYLGKWKIPSQEPCTVAIKVLLAHSSAVSDADINTFNKRMKRELQIWQSLEHINIVPLYGIVEGGHFTFSPAMVSPWMDNGTLTDYMKQYHATMTMEVRYRIFRLIDLSDIIAGLSYLHISNVVHGDLTGSNVLIDGDGTAMISDFGLSYKKSDEEAESIFPSRPSEAFRWISPELYHGDDASPVVITAASDIYSFGCIMLQVFSGQIPYPYMKGFSVVVQLAKGHEHRRPDPECVSMEHWAFIKKCWMREPSQRPTTASVVNAIRQFPSQVS